MGILDDVTVCAPCDQGAKHPESHAENARVLLADRCLVTTPNTLAALALANAVRNGVKVDGPITVHQGPPADVNPDGQVVCEWVATQP